MNKRKFGKHNDLLSIVGLGGISIKNSGQQSASNLVDFAIDNGVNYFDVAPRYGDAQELMGNALFGKRNQVFLACKSTNRDKKGSQKDLENSLRLLQTDRFDLYQLHAMKTEEDFEKATSQHGVLETLVKARKEGKVRYLGFSCHSIRVAELLLDFFEFDSILFPVNWALYLKSKFGPSIIERCQKENIAVLCLKAMAETLWEDPDNKEFEKCWYKPLSDQKMIDLSVKFTLSQPVVSFLPPGDEKLFKMGLKAANNYSEISEYEFKYLENIAKNTSPIGSEHEVFI